MEYEYIGANPKKSANTNYVLQSINQNQTPLPILNRLQDGLLPLIYYQLNEANSIAFAKVLKQIVPIELSKLYLVNNNLADKDIALICNEIAKTEGLTTIAIIENNLGPLTYQCFA